MQPPTYGIRYIHIKADLFGRGGTI